MLCPNCKERMDMVSHPDRITHACIYCNGVWVSGLDLDELLAQELGLPTISETLSISCQIIR